MKREHFGRRQSLPTTGAGLVDVGAARSTDCTSLQSGRKRLRSSCRSNSRVEEYPINKRDENQSSGKRLFRVGPRPEAAVRGYLLTIQCVGHAPAALAPDVVRLPKRVRASQLLTKLQERDFAAASRLGPCHPSLDGLFVASSSVRDSPEGPDGLGWPLGRRGLPSPLKAIHTCWPVWGVCEAIRSYCGGRYWSIGAKGNVPFPVA